LTLKEARAVFGLDDWIAGMGTGSALLLATVVAMLLGLRHATDPDHLTAVSTIVASAPDDRARRAARVGLAWGAGHGTTLFLFGLPIVLAAAYLPEALLESAEVMIGVLIIALAVRLLLRWRRGLDHASHHVGPGPGRSLAGAYGIGLVHGLGGSAGVGVL